MKNYLNNLEKSVLSMMIDNLDDMEGREGYISELAFDLFESENATEASLATRGLLKNG